MIWEYEYEILKYEFLTNRLKLILVKVRLFREHFQVNVSDLISIVIFRNVWTYFGKNKYIFKLKSLPTNSPPRLGLWSRNIMPIRPDSLMRPIYFLPPVLESAHQLATSDTHFPREAQKNGRRSARANPAWCTQEAHIFFSLQLFTRPTSQLH
jgi:hypothetical protein